MDLVQVLTQELEGFREPFAKACERFGTLPGEDPAFFESIEDVSTQLERIGGGVGAAGFAGVNSFTVAVNELVVNLAMEPPETRTEHAALIAEVPNLIAAYIANPAEPDHTMAFMGVLAALDTQGMLDDQRISAIATELAAGATADEDAFADETPPRPTEARQEDVSVAIAPGAAPKLLEAYFGEAPGNAHQFSAHLQQYLANPADHDALTAAKRLAHTLKGSSHIAGLNGVGNVAHQVEDIFDLLDETGNAPPAGLDHALLAAADCMESMIEAAQGIEAAPPHAQQVLQEVLDWANRLEAGDWSDHPVDLARAPRPVPVIMSPTDALSVAPQPQAADIERKTRVSTRTIDAMLRLVGELNLSVGRLQTRLLQSQRQATELRNQNTLLAQRLAQLEELVTIRGAGLEQRKAAHDPAFDPLEFDEYSELASVTSGLAEAANDVRAMGQAVSGDLTQLGLTLGDNERLSKELQDKLLSSRLAPVHDVVPRLQRAVRQTAQMTGKGAVLDVEGEEVQVDGELLDRLMDPLLHLLRNAVDHGIEQPLQRTQQGKPEHGTIHLAFKRSGPNLLVTIADDGPGLDLERIRQKAVTGGFIPNNARPSDDELQRLILLPGFSTRDRVSEVSGRGIGLDVVRERVQALKGMLTIRSRRGEGTTFEMRLPASMLALHALVIRVKDERFAIPSAAVRQAFPPGLGRIVDDGAHRTYHVGDQMFPLREFSELVNYAAHTDADALARLPVIVVETDNGPLALVVDEILAAREFLSRGLGPLLQGIRGVSSVSLMPDGNPIPIVDLNTLATAWLDPALAASRKLRSAQVIDDRPMVLVVDDSLSVRRTLTELLEDAGYRVAAASDGLEAVESVRKLTPRVILTDMEMPRMNGLELTSHLRRQPEFEAMPIIMITSRSTQKHRDMAKQAGVSRFVTKPYSELALVKEVQDLIAAA